MAKANVVSLAERLRQRREELGLSQAQAARELDVARTAYRLWEMEAAKPQPDRWRLISRWLGVSVTTMLLADELEDETQDNSSLVADAFDRVGREWSHPVVAPSEYFARGRHVIQDGVEKGFLTAEHAQELLTIFDRIEKEQSGVPSDAWEPAKLYKELESSTRTARTARDALDFIANDLPAASLRVAQLLATELVTNSVRHGPQESYGRIGLLIDVNHERLRVEVTDAAARAPQLTAPTETGGYGLALVDRMASRWDTTRTSNGNLTWFELDLPRPGATPGRQ